MNIILYDFEIQNLLKNRKGQIRRVCKVQPLGEGYILGWLLEGDKKNKGKLLWIKNDLSGKSDHRYFTCPFGAVGEKLIVKETWCRVTRLNDCYGKRSNLCGGIDSWDYYKTDGKKLPDEFVWESPVTMPREASRMTIVPERIWAEPLQKISPSDAFYSGMTRDIGHQLGESVSESEETFNLSYQPKDVYKRVWNRHNKPGYKWANNPMVFAAEVRME